MTVTNRLIAIRKTIPIKKILKHLDISGRSLRRWCKDGVPAIALERTEKKLTALEKKKKGAA
jgi:hypothetical protein